MAHPTGARRPARPPRRPALLSLALATVLALAAPAFGQGFVPAGQLAPTTYVSVLLTPDFPYYATLCPAGSDRRPVVYGFAAENRQFSQKAVLRSGQEQLLGIAVFACREGADAPEIRVPSPIETGRLIDSGILGGWRWSDDGAYGAVFSKTVFSGSRKLVTACIEAGTGKCAPVSGSGACPFHAVTRNSAILDALQQLIATQIGSGNIDYAWLVDYGNFSAVGKPSRAPTNDPSKISLFVRSNASVTCSYGEELPPDMVRVLDQSSVVFVTDGTCAYRSGTGRIVYYYC